jgi:hypothetical protein
MERSAARKVAASPALGSKPAPAVSSPVLVGPRPPNPVAPVPMPVPVPMPLPVVPPVPVPAPGVKVPVPGVPPHCASGGGGVHSTSTVPRNQYC